ncbi:MAG TPA: hypothetical protein VNS33_11500 [Bradyrhizobium sp.]|nr:hypothetical protein [Bradyrhizobium sp.]
MTTDPDDASSERNDVNTGAGAPSSEENHANRHDRRHRHDAREHIRIWPKHRAVRCGNADAT